MALPNMTIGERIIVHLSQYVRRQDAFVCPPGMSQAGIAASLGITRAHAAIELRRQMDVGRVAVRIAHVTGAPTRRKVYALTPRGLGIVHSVRGRVFRVTRVLCLPEGRTESMEGGRALETLRRYGIPEGRALFLLLTLDRIDVEKAAQRDSPQDGHARVSVEARAMETFRRTFVQPVAWQLEVVLGPPNVPPFPAAA